MLGDGTGGFTAAPGAPIPTPGFTSFAVAGDFNRDGKPDLVIANGSVWLNALPTLITSLGTVRFYAGAGTPPKPIPLTVSPSKGVSATSNQKWIAFDGRQVSVLSAAFSAGTYRGDIHLNAPGYFGVDIPVSLNVSAPSGTLTIAPGSPFPARGTYTATADFNEDGKPDLVTADSGNLTVWFGDGQGGFRPAPAPIPIRQNGSLVVADFNLDGHMDVAISASSIQVYFGDGSGGFTAGPVNHIEGEIGAVTADFNRDGLPDLAVLALLDLRVLLLLGDGHGGFSSSVAWSGLEMPLRIATGDFRGAGIADLILQTQVSTHVLLGDGNGGFIQTQRLDFDNAKLAAVGDWNGDGRDDLILTFINEQGAAPVFSCLLSDDKGTLTKSSQFSLPSGLEFNGDVLSADFDGDGNVDIALGLENSRLAVFLGDGKGFFRASPGGTILLGGTFLSSSSAVADFNGDGRADILVPTRDAISVLIGSSVTNQVTMVQEPPNPFDIGQTVRLNAQLIPAAGAFQPPTGSLTLLDGSSTVGTADIADGPASFLTLFTPRTHIFTANYSGDARNLPVSTSLTVIEAGSPTSIQSLGSMQPFRVLVQDANNNPVAGVRVTFAAPATGPSGLFGDSLTVAVLTDIRGIATAPAFTRNAFAGSYSITATTLGNISTAITLQN
jgi:hypothetical protein